MRQSIRIPSPDIEALAWRSSVLGDGGTVTTAQFQAVNVFLQGIKSDGIRPRLSRFWLYGAGDFHGAKYDLLGRTAHTLHGGLVFTANTGYQGTAGAGVYIDTNMPLQSDLLYTRDDHCSGGYVVATGADSSSNGFWGNNSLRCFFGRNGASQYWYCDNNNTSTNINVTGTTTGLFHEQRTDGTHSTVFRNGVSISTQANPSVAIDAGNMQTFCRGATNNPSDVQLACHYFGASIVGLETALFNRVKTLLNTFNPGLVP